MNVAITVLHVTAAILLGASAGLALMRMTKGPTSLDRSIAADVMIAVMVAGTGLFAIISKLDTMLPTLLVLSLLGFTSAVSMARLISSRSSQVREASGQGDLGAAESSDHTGMLPVVRIQDDAAKADQVQAQTVGEEDWDDQEPGEAVEGLEEGHQ